jgi:LEA14-like dessication related protein
MKKIVLIIISIFIFTSCKFKDVTVGDVQNIAISEMTDEYVAVDLFIPINNPNNFAFKISKINLDIALNGIDLGKAYKMTKVKVPANSNNTHKFTIKIKLNNVANSSMAFLGAMFSNQAKLKLNGYIKAKAFVVGSKKIDVDMNKSVKLFKNL